MVEHDIIALLRDRFDAQDMVLRDIKESLVDHTKKDEHYWKMIDDQQAQLRMVKWMSTGLSGSALTAWLWNKFGH